MLLFSRVDVTLHGGGGTPGGCSVYGMTAAAQLYREVIGCRPSHVQYCHITNEDQLANVDKTLPGARFVAVCLT